MIFTEVIPAALAAAAIALAVLSFGVAAGALARRAVGGPPTATQIPLLDAFVIGFPIFGTLIGIVAWIGVAMHAVIATVVLAAAACGVIIVVRRKPAIPRVPPILIIPIGIAVFEAITPVNSPDELIYKLAVPHAYDMAGRMFEMPLNSNSYLTLALQLADLPALVLGSPVTAKLVHFALYLAALMVLRRLTRSDWITAVVAWTPALMLIAGWAWAEWGVIALSILAIDRFESWLDTKSPLDAFISFAALGGSIACKYTALPWMAAFAILAWLRCGAGNSPALAAESAAPHRTRFLVRGALIVILFGSFFYIRNFVWTGSPVAPLLLPNAPHIQNYRGSNGWVELIHGVDVFDPRVMDESLGIVLVAAAICGLFMLRSPDRRLRDLALLGAIQMPILITIAPGSRNMIMGVIPLAIAGCPVLARIPRGLRAAGLALAFAAQLALVLYVLRGYELGPYLLGRESSIAYVHRMRNFGSVYSWIEANTSPQARILMLGENRTFDLDRLTVGGGNIDGPRVAAWLATFSTADALGVELGRQGVSYVLVHPAWMHAPRTPTEREYMLDLSPQSDALLKAFLRERATEVYRDSYYLLFEVRR